MLPADIRRAIRCGPVPQLGRWRQKSAAKLTRAERVMRFIEGVLRVPEGRHVGSPMVLNPFQQAFIYAIYDNEHLTTRAILSLARKNGKTALIAALLIVHLDGPEAKLNTQLVSGAMSRDQAALVFKLASKMVELQPLLSDRVRAIPSSKRLVGYEMNTEYKALAADGATAQGLSPVLAILDEIGQVRGGTNPFIEAITTSQGAHDDALLIAISTQAPSDADWLSLQIDDAARTQDKHTVCHVYESPPDCDMLDPKAQKMANPALGMFRSRADLQQQLERASRVPALESSARNLLLNQRIALETLWLSPNVWRDNIAPPDLAEFTRPGAFVAMGLDLSAKQDLTAAVLAVRDDAEIVHLLPFCYTPAQGIEARELRDRAPYTAWTKAGQLYAVPGTTVSYSFVAAHLRATLAELGINVAAVEFDRWRIDIFKQAATDEGFAQGASWNPVGQGYKDFSPRAEAFQSLLMSGRIRHGGHPLLNMAASNAIAEPNPAGDIKLAKHKSTQRIDPLVAAVMAAYAVTDGAGAIFDAAAIIG